MADAARLRLERIADIEGTARLANEHLAARAQEIEGAEAIRFRCECGNDACHEPLSITRELYERVRQDPMLFIVRPSHVLPEAEHVVETAEGYEIVRKNEDMRDVVERSFPRRLPD